MSKTLQEKEDLWKAWFHDCDTDGSGSISIHELRDKLQAEGEDLIEMFQDIAEGDDKITLCEFMEEMCKPCLKEQFEKFDTDNSGFLSEDEFIAMMQCLGKDEETVNKCMDLCDKNDDGKVCVNELHKVLYKD